MYIINIVKTKMTKYSETTKQYSYKWREKNREAYNQYMLNYINDRYDSDKRKRQYEWKKAKTEFLGILL